AIVGAALSGIGGAFGYRWFHASTAPLLTTWYHWFISDGLGIVTVAPLVIGLVAVTRTRPPRRAMLEGGVALVLLAILNGILSLSPRETWGLVLLTALFVPLLIWVAARCEPIFAAAAAFITSLSGVWTTTYGIGIFGDPNVPIAQRVLAAQADILAVSTC